MSTHRYIDAICIVVLILTLAITVLFMNGEALGIQVVVDEDAEGYSGKVYFTENDRKGDWDSSAATKITMEGSRITIYGGGAYAYDGNVVISNAGKYELSGTLSDGSIVVDTNHSAKVWIMLDGAAVTCTDGACLDIEQADKVFLTLMEGSENSMTTTGISSENLAAGMDGTIFARDDLTINGSGRLTVTASAEHGIVGNDDLVITGGEITVTAAADALHANDGLRIMAAELNLTAGDDGIALTGPESELYLESGKLTITAGGDGVNAENHILFAGGDLTIQAKDDGLSTFGVESLLKIDAGTFMISASDKGIATGGAFMLEAGSVSIDSVDDGISAVGEIAIDGGELTITTTDDGIHSDSAVWISGGTIQIPECYEGIEAVTIDVSGGDIIIYPDDDGLNANGASGMFGGFGGMPDGGQGGMPGGGHGMHHLSQDGQQIDGSMTETGDLPQGEPPEMPDGNGMPEPPAGMEEPVFGGLPKMPSQWDTPESAGTDGSAQSLESGTSADSEETWIHVSGGSITVINDTARDADGLDSNGDIVISGGTIRISFTNSGSNNALDYGSESGGTMVISGGEVIACGSYAMAEGFDSSSTQCSILYNIRRGAAAGTTIALEDKNGNVILSYEVPCSFSSASISCPEMELGETYIVVIGDSVEEITLNEVSASYGDAQSEGFDGSMNWGSMQFRPDSGPRNNRQEESDSDKAEG